MPKTCQSLVVLSLVRGAICKKNIDIEIFHDNRRDGNNTSSKMTKIFVRAQVYSKSNYGFLENSNDSNQ